MASLVLLKSPGGTTQREEIKLDGSKVILGRSPEDAQIIIPSQAVSRCHAQITVNDGHYFIEDLKSRNGTTVNNKPVGTPAVLKHDDKIKICDFLFVFQDEPSNRRPPPRELPAQYRKTHEAEPEQDVNTTTTIEATLGRLPQKDLLITQTNDRLVALLNIATLLSKQVKVDDLLNQVADELFGLFKQADRCFVILSDETGKQLIPKVIKSRRQGGSGGTDRFSKTIVRKSLDSGECFLSEDASGDANLAPSASIAEFRIKSVVCAPMVTPDGRALGVIQLDGDRSKKFNKDDMKLLQAVATQAAIALENVKLTEHLMDREKERREVELASLVQRGFLPQVFPTVPDYEFYAHYVAAQTIGGDYYDFIPLVGGKLAIVLGDVSGKSVPAALLMAKLSAESRFCMLTHPTDISCAINHLNDQLVNANLGDRYVTLCATVLDPITHTIKMVNAGHEMPMIYRAATATLEPAIPVDLSSFPLCWVPGNDYPNHSFELNPGDALILFTDGINDAESNEGLKFGREGISRVLLEGEDVLGDEPMTPQKIGERLIKAVQKHSAGRAQFDDIALVVYGRVESKAGVTQTTMSPAQK